MKRHNLISVSASCAILIVLVPLGLAQNDRSKEHPSGAPADPYSQKVKNTSFVSPTGERVLRHEIIINAGLQDVWNAMTTDDGLKSFMVPTAKIELKTGGAWETNYRIGSRIGDADNIRNQVLCYVPLEMLALKVNLTGAFPDGPRKAGTLFAVLTFKQLDPKSVLITESMAGWQQGPDWDKTWGFFDWGNAYTLGQLCKRFVEGPVDWNKREKAAR